MCSLAGLALSVSALLCRSQQCDKGRGQWKTWGIKQHSDFLRKSSLRCLWVYTCGCVCTEVRADGRGDELGDTIRFMVTSPGNAAWGRDKVLVLCLIWVNILKGGCWQRCSALHCHRWCVMRARRSTSQHLRAAFTETVVCWLFPVITSCKESRAAGVKGLRMCCCSCCCQRRHHEVATGSAASYQYNWCSVWPLWDISMIKDS